MEHLEEIFHAELKNLYALEKQIIAIIPTIEDNVSHKKLHKRIKTMKKHGIKQFEQIRDTLQDLDINPGNTTDQVASEIIINLDKIANNDFSDEVKDAGILSSLIRLHHYKVACYRISQRMAKTLGHDDLKSELKSVRKKSEKQLKKIRKVGKKKVFKKAVA